MCGQQAASHVMLSLPLGDVLWWGSGKAGKADLLSGPKIARIGATIIGIRVSIKQTISEMFPYNSILLFCAAVAVQVRNHNRVRTRLNMTSNEGI